MKYTLPSFSHFGTIFIATKAQNARQPYGLTDELVDSLLNGSTSHEEIFGEDGIYRQLTKRLFRANRHSFYIYGTLAQPVYLYTDLTKFYTDLTWFLHRFVVNITRMRQNFTPILQHFTPI